MIWKDSSPASQNSLRLLKHLLSDFLIENYKANFGFIQILDYTLHVLVSGFVIHVVIISFEISRFNLQCWKRWRRVSELSILLQHLGLAFNRTQERYVQGMTHHYFQLLLSQVCTTIRENQSKWLLLLIPILTIPHYLLKWLFAIPGFWLLRLLVFLHPLLWLGFLINNY